jgi:prefoldin subunit 5
MMANEEVVGAGVEVFNRLERIEAARRDKERIRNLEVKVDALEQRIEELASRLSWLLEAYP